MCVQLQDKVNQSCGSHSLIDKGPQSKKPWLYTRQRQSPLRQPQAYCKLEFVVPHKQAVVKYGLLCLAALSLSLPDCHSMAAQYLSNVLFVTVRLPSERKCNKCYNTAALSHCVSDCSSCKIASGHKWLGASKVVHQRHATWLYMCVEMLWHADVSDAVLTTSWESTVICRKTMKPKVAHRRKSLSLSAITMAVK